MNQDGSDAQPTSRDVGLSNDKKNLPRRMWLRLMDSRNKEIVSELVPFAQSYDEAVLCVLAAFPAQLNGDFDKERITLRLRPVDGTPSWAGLRAAKNSAEIWRYLLSNGSDTVEVGVFSINMDAENVCEQGKIMGRDGRPIEAVFYESTEVNWLDASPTRDHVPATYEECIHFIAGRISLAAYLNIEHEELKQRIQLAILNPTQHRWVGFKKSLYRETVQMHATSENPEVVQFTIHQMTPL